MALVACGECGKEVSDKAPACPGCGAPPAVQAGAPPLAKVKRKTSPVTWVALVAVIAGGAWYTQTREYKEQTLADLPVQVAFRDAIMGPGMVLQVKNTSNKPLMAMVKLRNPTTHQEKSFRIDVVDKGTTELGHKEGWVLASGDMIELSNAAYRSWKGSIP